MNRTQRHKKDSILGGMFVRRLKISGTGVGSVGKRQDAVQVVGTRLMSVYKA